MATQTHARRANAPSAGRQGQEVVDRPARVFIVRVQRLDYLPLIALIGAGNIVGERLGAGKVMIAARGGDDVALTGDLAGKTGNGTGHCSAAKSSSAYRWPPVPATKDSLAPGASARKEPPAWSIL